MSCEYISCDFCTSHILFLILTIYIACSKAALLDEHDGNFMAQAVIAKWMAVKKEIHEVKGQSK